MHYLGKSKRRGQGDERTTPLWLFNIFDQCFNFELDVAATDKNTLVRMYLTKEDNALEHEWSERNWMNPPFSMLSEFTQKAFDEACRGRLTVGIVPNDPSTGWWAAWVEHCTLRISPPVRVEFGGGGAGNPLTVVMVIWAPFTVYNRARWRELKAEGG